MTTPLDDGLNTSAPVFNPISLTADWLDLPAGYADNVKIDSLRDLGEQVGPQGVEIVQSLDDGLPDSVTMTSGNAASGTLASDLVGRHGVEVSIPTLGFTSFNSASNAGDLVITALPSDLEFMDYTISMVTITADAYVEEYDPAGGPMTWTLLGDVADGALRTFVFGRKHYVGATPPRFRIASGEVTSALGIVCFGVKAGRTIGGAYVEVSPERAVSAAQGAGSLSSHVAPAAKLPSMGFNLAFFGTTTAFGPLSATGDAISVGSHNTGVSMLALRTPLRTITPLTQSITANSSISTSTMTMVSVPMVVRERPFFDAAAYFSPFNKQSPVFGFERDTAPVTAAVNVVTPQGNVSTPIFNGIMNDIPVSGRTANLDASSATRLRLDKSVTVPTVNGYREGCNTDWLIGYLLACGGQYTGVCPGPNTRFWAPMHGSLHPWMDGPATFPSATLYTTARTPGVPYRYNDLAAVDGPFVSGMYAQMKSAEVIQLGIQNDVMQWATEVPGVDNPLTYDIHSKKNSKGRMSVRLRGDTFDVAPAALNGAEDWIFAFTLYNYTTGGGAGNYTRFQINSNKTITTWVGNSFNYTAASYPSFQFVDDGSWQLFGFAWSYGTGESRIRRNGSGVQLITGYSGSQEQLPNSMADLYNQGLFTGLVVQSRVPMSEFQVEFGPEVWTAQPWNPSGGGWQWTGAGTPPGSNSLNATYRPTRQPLAGVAIGAPVQGWPLLQSLAQSTLSHMRINEEDNAEFLPLEYFGETEQLTVETVNLVDTSLNAAELSIVSDASKIRNQATTEFQEVRVATSRSVILETNASIAIPRGETFRTFALDKQTVETHGASVWQTSTPDVVKLTSAQIGDPDANPIPNEHVMTVNLLPDGTGTVVASTVFQARVVSWDNSTVTIRFRNNWPKTLYLANNGNQVPTLRILGYELESADAYATVRDPGSVGLRRERALTTSLEWVHDRDTALERTTQLVSILSRPRPQMSVTVMGDPRRRPGQLVSILDTTGTRAEGRWRILAVKHRVSGAMYVNDLDLVRVGDISIWDESLWDNAVWGE